MNVIMLVLEAVRPDHLSCYGYNKNTTPFLSLFTERSTIFQPLQSFSSDEALALNALLRSLEDKTVSGFKSGKGLPQVLKEHGLVTVAVTSKKAWFEEHGFDVGFDKVVNASEASQEFEAERVAHACIKAIKEHAKEDFFLLGLFSHLAQSYSVPESLASMFPPAEYVKNRKRLKVSAGNECYKKLPKVKKLGKHLDPAFYCASYDACLRLLDDSLEKVVRAVDEADISHKTLLIIVGAQGESLGEHNYFFCHGSNLYEEQIRVPFIVKGPKIPIGKQVTGLARTIDVAPTVLHYLSIKPPPSFCGTSLLNAIYAGSINLPAVSYLKIEQDSVVKELEVLRSSNWKLMRTSMSKITYRTVTHRKPYTVVKEVPVEVKQSLLDSIVAAFSKKQPEPKVVKKKITKYKIIKKKVKHVVPLKRGSKTQLFDLSHFGETKSMLKYHEDVAEELEEMLSRWEKRQATIEKIREVARNNLVKKLKSLKSKLRVVGRQKQNESSQSAQHTSRATQQTAS
jgi:hypothetical protein